MSSVQVGDEVEILVSSNPRPITSRHVVYTVVTVPSNSPSDSPFWELSNSGNLYVIHAPVILVKVGGAP